MGELKFDAQMARLQRALAQCHDMVVRRTSVMGVLNLQTGEQVLEFGCGGGLYAYEAAQFVGPNGRVCAIDISEDQITAARQRCEEFAIVDCQVGNVINIPYEESGFDVQRQCVQPLAGPDD